MGMINDPISDMLTRIRNASAVGKGEVVLPFSNIKQQIALILHNEGYVGKVTKLETTETQKSYAMLRIGLKYGDDRKMGTIKAIKRISKPGLRVYKKKDELPTVLNNLGIAIVSTSKGLMTNKEAKKHGLGGEIICEVY